MLKSCLPAIVAAAAIVCSSQVARRFDCKPVTVCPTSQVASPNIDYLARDYPALLDAGCNIVGACCGSNPEHIRLISELVKRRNK